MRTVVVFPANKQIYVIDNASEPHVTTPTPVMEEYAHLTSNRSTGIKNIIQISKSSGALI